MGWGWVEGGPGSREKEEKLGGQGRFGATVSGVVDRVVGRRVRLQK